MIEGFTALMAVILHRNLDVAPNYLTFSLNTKGHDKFALTIQRVGGMTPAEKIAELEDQLKRERAISDVAMGKTP